MKRKLFTLVLYLIFAFNIQAQDYVPVIQDGSFWDVTTTGPGVCAFLYKYRLGSDFVHNGITYKNIEKAPIRGDQFPDDLCHPNGTPYADENEFTPMNIYMREDVAAKKVYVLDVDENGQLHEYTMADFNLEVGDIMTNAYSIPIDGSTFMGADLEITQISVLPDGRKRYYVENQSEGYEEGVGGNQGPAQMYRPYLLYEDSNHVSCHGNDATDNSSCVPVLSVDDFQLSQIKIFGNPTVDKISFTNLENNTFKLYSMLGKEISVEFSREYQEIDISHLESGMYLLEIRGENGGKRIEKILKN